MTVLVLNAGSSTLKFRLFDVADRARPRARARGAIDRFGEHATLTLRADAGDPVHRTVAVADHAAGVRCVLDALDHAPVDAVGHRIVHGGERFTRSTLIRDDVLAAIEALEPLAPLHNAPGLDAIRACRAALGPDVPMVAVFDTAFHATLPEHAYRYALPWDLAQAHGVRRYGFHGTSYRYVVERYAELAGKPVDQVTIIALHLGAGSSAAAIARGRSVDTSMGLTPLEGLVMATRSGDVDPSVVGFLARHARVPLEEVEHWLNHRSGLYGIAGGSGDLRDLLSRDDARARLAVSLYCYRARKYVGAYLAALGGADAIVFTGGIGEHQPEIRERICDGMDWCGLVIDRARNRASIGTEAVVSASSARIRALVIPTDEEVVIARDTVACVRGEA